MRVRASSGARGHTLLICQDERCAGISRLHLEITRREEAGERDRRRVEIWRRKIMREEIHGSGVCNVERG